LFSNSSKIGDLTFFPPGTAPALRLSPAISSSRQKEVSTMEPVPVRMTVKWSMPPGEAQAITAVLQSLMVRTRAEPGCTGCMLSTEMGPRVAIQYLEKWESETALQRQVQSDRFAALAELIERAGEAPVIEFALPKGIRGIEYAEEVRRSHEVA
jgi:quinol monooxygenase YgiN